jgi:phage terminase large subunit-like protein
VLDETHHWLQANGGHKLAEVIRRNLGKSRDGAARSVETTNAHEQGSESVAERSYDAWQAQLTGKARSATVLYDSREAPPDVDLADEEFLLAALEATYGDSSWVDLERIRDEIYDPGTPPSVSRQFYLNQLSVAEDAWVAPDQWDACADPTVVVADRAEITLGFDGSKSDDHSALIGCLIDSDHLFELGVWAPVAATGEVDRADIDRVVRATFERFDVVGFYSDLHPFESYVDAWAEDLGDGLVVKATLRQPVAWDIRARGQQFTAAVERLHDAIVEAAVTHCGSARFRQHVHNARRAPNKWGVSVRKEHRESARKIDSVPAAVLARLARQDYLSLSPSKRRRKQRSGRVW